MSSHDLGYSDLSDVHVVINSYGREAWYVERAITSILQQAHPPASIHLIDQNAQPLTLAPLLASHKRIQHHHLSDRRGAHARNMALKLVREGWIAFADDDAHWHPNYSAHLVRLLRSRPNLQLIAGAVIDEQTGQLYTLRHKIGGTLNSFLGSKLLCGANFLVRADLFASVGGYDIRFGPGTAWPSSEEADLCWRLLLCKPHSIYAQELAVLHPPMHNADSRAAAIKAHAYGIGKGSLTAVWLLERRAAFGVYELVEMSFVPIAKILLGLIRRNAAEVRIQTATLRGRHRGFWQFALGRQPIDS